MEKQTTSPTALQPLSCPRCGCPASRVLKSRRMNQRANPEPLPALRRTRICDHCEKRFYTRETVEEVRLESSVWRVTEAIDGFRYKAIERESLPDGEYTGRWTAYEVSVEMEGRSITLHTRNDMRVADYPCRVLVDRQGIRVESRRADDE